MVMRGHRPFLFISDPAVVSDMYMLKNKLFDKHPMVQNATYALIGRSILFADTDEVWKERRKALSVAFYKGKLVQMIETAKEAMQGTLKRW